MAGSVKGSGSGMGAAQQKSGNIINRDNVAPGGDTAVAPGGKAEFMKALNQLQGSLSVEAGLDQAVQPGTKGVGG